MKGAAPNPHKRGWRGFCFPVLSLVLLSLLVPLFFLVNQSGYSVENDTPTDGLKRFDPDGHADARNPSEGERGDKSKRVDDLIKRLGPGLSKDVIERFAKKADSESVASNIVSSSADLKGKTDDTTSLVFPPPALPKSSLEFQKERDEGVIGHQEFTGGISAEEAESSCQLVFGSYCLWRDEHKEEMKDSVVKKLKDQLFVARAYYPSIAKLASQDKLSRDMKLNIQEYERMLSETTSDSDLPPLVEKKMEKMEQVIAKAKEQIPCGPNVDKKFRQLLDLTEDEAHFHMKQSAFLYQLGVQTMPKSLHCLSMRLTVEYFRSHSADMELLQEDDKHEDPRHHHYVIFSNHILAVSVVINSTMMHSKETADQVFHVVTDGQNYFAMKLWFFRNNYRNATIDVLNIEEFDLKYTDGAIVPHQVASDEFRVTIRSAEKLSSIQMRTEYISVFGSAHFFLPELFPNLKRVVVLDDDVVIQQDLTPLWSLDMQGKVIGAVEYCRVRLGQLRTYLGEDILNDNSCAWMSGLNVIDLERWRELNVTETYQGFLLKHRKSGNKMLETAGTLPANLLTCQDLIYALDSSWLLSGLGHDYGILRQKIKQAAVLHYNGNMKPWLDLGIKKYQRYWNRSLLRDDQFMDDCNVNR